jgi:hypothetical protein
LHVTVECLLLLAVYCCTTTGCSNQRRCRLMGNSQVGGSYTQASRLCLQFVISKISKVGERRNKHSTVSTRGGAVTLSVTTTSHHLTASRRAAAAAAATPAARARPCASRLAAGPLPACCSQRQQQGWRLEPRPQAPLPPPPLHLAPPLSQALPLPPPRPPLLLRAPVTRQLVQLLCPPSLLLVRPRRRRARSARCLERRRPALG